MALPDDLPTRNVPKVTHIGSLNPEDKKSHSYEGPALSVTTHPEEWRRIAKLGGAPTHVLQGGEFIDRHHMSSAQWQGVRKWATEQGHVTPSWEVTTRHDDDEMGEYEMTHSSTADAIEELRDRGEPLHVYKRRTVTPVNKTEARGMPGDDYALLKAAEATGKRGVWWQDENDGQWSAPRGGMLPPYTK